MLHFPPERYSQQATNSFQGGQGMGPGYLYPFSRVSERTRAGSSS